MESTPVSAFGPPASGASTAATPSVSWTTSKESTFGPPATLLGADVTSFSVDHVDSLPNTPTHADSPSFRPTPSPVRPWSLQQESPPTLPNTPEFERILRPSPPRYSPSPLRTLRREQLVDFSPPRSFQQSSLEMERVRKAIERKQRKDRKGLEGEGDRSAVRAFARGVSRSFFPLP